MFKKTDQPSNSIIDEIDCMESRNEAALLIAKGDVEARLKLLDAYFELFRTYKIRTRNMPPVITFGSAYNYMEELADFADLVENLKENG